MKIKEALITSQISKEVNLDIQRPRVIDGSVNVNNELSTANNRRVDFEITDGGGSGVKEYAIVKERTCKGTEYNQKKKSTSDGIQTEYLENGDYYICVEDKVGNRTSDEDLENVANQIHVSNIDKGSPVIHEFSIRSRESYKSLKTVLTINSSDDNGVENLKMCISNTGYLKDCSWERYNTTKNWDLPGSLDGVERTVYLSIQDASGNITKREAKYTPYKECSSTNKVTVGDFSACSVSCGGGVQYQNYQNKDKNTGKVCSTGKNERKCNEQSCEPTLKRIGDYIDGLIIPLKKDRFIVLNGDGEDGTTPNPVTGEYDMPGKSYQNSWIDASLMDETGKTILKKRISSGKEGMGYGVDGIRINDNTVFIIGISNHRNNYNSTSWDSYHGAILKITDTNITVVEKQSLMYKIYSTSPTNFLYQEGEEDIVVYFYKPCTSGCRDYYKRYEFNKEYTSFKLVESDRGNSPDKRGDAIRLRESLLPSNYECQENPFYALSKNVLIGINGESLYENNRCLTRKITPFYTYPTEYQLNGIGRYNETKFVQLVRGEDKKYYLYFFQKEAGSWNVKHTIEAPEHSGIFISMNESLVLYNSKDGLYQIPFN